jgi:cell volume regulation protein A
MSVAAWLVRELGHEPGTGDRVPLGEVELIVRAMDWDDSISEVGLAVEPTIIDKPKLPLFQSRAELRGMVRRWLGKGANS